VVEYGVGTLGSLLPEIILLFGGLLILIMDMGQQKNQAYKKDTGTSFMAVSVLFLIVALIGAILQWRGFVDGAGFNNSATKAYVAMSVIDVDHLTVFFKVILYVGMTLVAVAGGSYMNRISPVNGRGEFWSLFLFITLAMSLAASASNLIMLFLAFEFLSIGSYILVGIQRDTKRSSEAGLKYFLYGSIASSVMLYGMSLLYGASGSLDLREIATGLSSSPEIAVIAAPAILLVLVGVGFKMSLVPFFQWAPDTYEGAPTPITAYLSTASKTVGFAIATRIFLMGFGGFRTEWVPILAGLAILTMTVGNLMALRQENVKRMLAYSSVAQAGYILMGLVSVVTVSGATNSQVDINTLGMNGLNGMLIYLFAYVFTNVGAFMVVMAIEEETGNAERASFKGLMQRSPFLALSMLIFLLSLTGIPLTGGFIGKFYVFGAAIQHQYWLLAIAGFINSGIAAGYYLPVVGAMLFGDDEEAESADDAAVATVPSRLNISISLQSALAICVIATLVIGTYQPNFIAWADNASRDFLALIP